MEILPGIEMHGLSLYIKAETALVISDVHIGMEESLNKQGILVPRFQLKKVLDELEKLLGELKPDKIIINGDLKHEFGGISEQEWRDTLKVLDLLSKDSRKVFLIKGNHDTILGPIAEKRRIHVVDHLTLGDIYFTHGDKIPQNEEFRASKLVIIGHEHPAVSIREKSRIELFKCFLVGRYKSKKLAVMPSINFVTEGTDVLRERLLSPFLTDIKSFRVYVVADEIYDFGMIKDLLSGH